jgi:hypothetical protein
MSVEQYFAEIDNNDVVVNIHVVTQQFLDDNPKRYPGVYVETFINLPNKTYAAIGYSYDRANNDFVPPVYPPAPPTVE